MTCLQVVKTPPEGSALFLLEALGRDQQVTRFNLYQDRDYAKLVELIFSHEVVQSWW